MTDIKFHEWQVPKLTDGDKRELLSRVRSAPPPHSGMKVAAGLIVTAALGAAVFSAFIGRTPSLESELKIAKVLLKEDINRKIDISGDDGGRREYFSGGKTHEDI